MEIPESKAQEEIKKSREDVLPNKFYANDRWTNSLNLRKKKLNELLAKQRGFERFKKEGNKDYEISKDNLNIEPDLKNKIFDDVEIFLKEMKKYIKDQNIEYNKYALFCLRNQITNNNNFNNKIYLTEELVKKDFISDILNLFQKYFDNKQVIFEGLWIIINIIYFLKDINELSLFLTNKNCINLYIKILDKKDPCLRLNTYWLIANLICNDNANVTQQVLFHLYMSPFFRLYIFKNLDDGVQMTETEYDMIFSILSRLTDFINQTYVCLRTNQIQQFINYNSEVDFGSIQENNNFLFYHSLKYFIANIENQKLKFYCIYGLSKLTNFLDDQQAYNEFFKSGIARKLVRQEIKYDESCLDFVVQIIGNFLSCTEDELIDLIFLQEILEFFIKLLQNYPERQFLKRDIFWSASNITSGSKIFCEKFAESGMLQMLLQSIYTDNDLVVNEALFSLLGFFDKQNLEVIVKFHYLDYIKCLTLCLKNLKEKNIPGNGGFNKDIIEKLFNCFGFLFENGELLKGNLKNKFVYDFEKNGGFDLLENILSENIFSQDLQNLGENMLRFRNC